MRIDILTVLPQLLESPFADSIMKRAVEKGLATIEIHDIRAYSQDKHRRVDDYPYGGGAGMVMTPEPIANCIESLKKEREYDAILYMTPDGHTWNQKLANQYSLKGNIIILCGHYKGVDHRIREHYITHEISIGDFVMSGGELAAAVVTDSIIRLLPGVLNDETSALTDSFQDDLLAPEVYTRPRTWNGYDVPEVLTSGDDGKIDHWRHENALKRTQALRPDLYKKYQDG